MNGLITRGGLFDDFFKDVAPGFYVKPMHGDPLPAQIKVDVKETPAAYTVEAEIPGVSREDIHVTIEGPVVTLRAEVRQMDGQSDGERVLRSERFFGSVARSFQLPQDLDEASAKAKYDNGVLRLTLPKKAAVAGQRHHRADGGDRERAVGNAHQEDVGAQRPGRAVQVVEHPRMAAHELLPVFGHAEETPRKRRRSRRKSARSNPCRSG